MSTPVGRQVKVLVSICCNYPQSAASAEIQSWIFMQASSDSKTFWNPWSFCKPFRIIRNCSSQKDPKGLIYETTRQRTVLPTQQSLFYTIALGSKLQSRNQSASLLQSLARAQIVLEHWDFLALLSALSWYNFHQWLRALDLFQLQTAWFQF